MTLETRELLRSDDARQDSFIDLSRTRVFRVFDDAGATVTTQQALAAPGMPQYGFPHPTLPSLVASRSSAVRVEGHNDLVEVTWEYRLSLLNEPDGLSFDSDFETEFRDIYRDAPFLAFPDMSPQVIGASADIPANRLYTDIGGVSKDVGGEPLSRLFVKQSIVVSETLFTIPPFTLYLAAAGKRNSSFFFNAPPGIVVYFPGTSTRTSESTYRVTHRFVQDQFYHLVQVPQRHQDADNKSGDIQLRALAGVTGTLVAKGVFWRQPFIGLFDFNQLSANF